MKEKIWRYYHYNYAHRYVNVLEDIVAPYNHTVHRSIKLKPDQVDEHNEAEVWETFFGDWNHSNLTKTKFVLTFVCNRLVYMFVECTWLVVFV